MRRLCFVRGGIAVALANGGCRCSRSFSQRGSSCGKIGRDDSESATSRGATRAAQIQRSSACVLCLELSMVVVILPVVIQDFMTAHKTFDIVALFVESLHRSL